VNDPAAVLMEKEKGKRWVNNGKYTGMVFQKKERKFEKFVVINLYYEGNVEVVFEKIESIVDKKIMSGLIVSDGIWVDKGEKINRDEWRNWI